MRTMSVKRRWQKWALAKKRGNIYCSGTIVLNNARARQEVGSDLQQTLKVGPCSRIVEKSFTV